MASSIDPLDVPSQYYDPERKGFVDIRGSMTPTYSNPITETFWESPFGKILGSSLNFMLPDRAVSAIQGKNDPYTGRAFELRPEDKVEISAALFPQSMITAGVAKMGAVPLLIGGISGALPKVGNLLSRGRQVGKGKKGFARVMSGMSYTSWEKKYGNKAVKNLPDNLKDFAKIIYYYRSFARESVRPLGETWKTNKEMLRRALQGYYERAISLKNERGNLVIPKRAYPDIMKLGGIKKGQRYIAHRYKHTLSGELVDNNLGAFSALLEDVGSIKHNPGTQVSGNVLKSIRDTLARFDPEILDMQFERGTFASFLRAKLLEHGIKVGDELTDAPSWYIAKDKLFKKAQEEVPDVRGARSGTIDRGRGQGINLMQRIIAKEYLEQGLSVPRASEVRSVASAQYNLLPKSMREEIAFSYGPEWRILEESGVITPNLHHGLFMKNTPNLRAGILPQSTFWAEGRPFDSTIDEILTHGAMHPKEAGLLAEAEAGGRTKIKQLGNVDVRDVASEIDDHQKWLVDQGEEYWSPYNDRRRSMPQIYRSILELNPTLHEANIIRARRHKKKGPW